MRDLCPDTAEVCTEYAGLSRLRVLRRVLERFVAVRCEVDFGGEALHL
jgi:hypothetical protein